MLVIKEVIATLQAKGFTNGDRSVSGKIVRELPDGPFSIEVAEGATGVKDPAGRFATEQDARDALMQFWKDCEHKLSTSGMPGWWTKSRL